MAVESNSTVRNEMFCTAMLPDSVLVAPTEPYPVYPRWVVCGEGEAGVVMLGGCTSLGTHGKWVHLTGVMLMPSPGANM